MNPVIMKFGGASVASPKSILRVADLIVERKKECSKLVVVVSAMANMTDQLLGLARSIHPNPPKREEDMLVSVGERISIALLAMALNLKGLNAISFTGSQSGILTNDQHSEAKIIDVRPMRILQSLEQERIVIVAGFQGMSRKGEITTLGRGGSDTTAVALAVALGSDMVEFYKDVGGIYDQDPHLYSNAKLLRDLSFDEALSLAEDGAKVLHARSIKLAQANGVKLHVVPFSLEKGSSGSVVGFRASRFKNNQFEQE